MTFERPLTEYLSTGANRHTAVGDWDADIVAFGADINIGLWQPQVSVLSSSFSAKYCYKL